MEQEPKPTPNLAKIAYEAWDREAREHVGAAPPWESLPRGIQNAWVMAVEAALEAAFEADRVEIVSTEAQGG